jgi:RNA polymerase sigma-70 factor (ECF subfamily)
MENESSFAEMMSNLRGGDAAAAERIFHAFARRLVGLARSRLTHDVRTKADPEDVVQSVFRSFFTRQADGQLEVAGWNELWSLLTVITLRKCGHKVEHYRAACRDVKREAKPAPVSDESVSSFSLIARDASPSEAAVMIETVERLTKELGERDRTVLELSLQGEKVSTISQRLGSTERTVERALERIRRRLEKLVT